MVRHGARVEQLGQIQADLPTNCSGITRVRGATGTTSQQVLCHSLPFVHSTNISEGLLSTGIEDTVESKARKAPAHTELSLQGKTHKNQVNKVTLTNSDMHSAK